MYRKGWFYKCLVSNSDPEWRMTGLTFLFISDIWHRLKGKTREKKIIKTWPIYPEHAGMWSRLNFSPKMCGCVWCSCSFMLRRLSQLGDIFYHLRIRKYSVRSWVWSLHITHTSIVVIASCMETNTTSCRFWGMRLKFFVFKQKHETFSPALWTVMSYWCSAPGPVPAASTNRS